MQYVWCWKHQLPELCLRLCSLASGRGSLRSFGHIKRYQNFYSWGPNVVLFTVSVFLPSSVPQYFLSESIQFRSLLAPVVRDNGPVWPLMRPSFPLQLQKPLPSNRHCCSPSYANTLILHSQLLWKALALFFLLLQSVRLDGIILNLYFSLLNNSFKKSTFHGEYMCIICWLVLALLFIYINIYI